MTEIIIWIIIGIAAGFIAEKVMKGNHGLLTNLIVGLVGAFIGGFLKRLIEPDGALLGNPWIDALVFASLGAIILLFVLRLVKRAT